MSRVFKYSHPILKKWLSGTICDCCWVGRSILFENDDFIVLKHNSHAGYAGRFSGNGACKAYAKLYRKSDLLGDESGSNREDAYRNLAQGDGEMARWDGRISKTKVLAECKAMGIIFDPARVLDNSEDTTPDVRYVNKDVEELGNRAAKLTGKFRGKLWV